MSDVKVLVTERDGVDLAENEEIKKSTDVLLAAGLKNTASDLVLTDNINTLKLNDLRNVNFLGNPPADGYVLSSTAAGVRSWTSPSVLSGKKYIQAAAIYTAGTTYTITHNLSSNDLLVQFFRASDNAAVNIDFVESSVNSIAFTPAATINARIALLAAQSTQSNISSGTYSAGVPSTITHNLNSSDIAMQVYDTSVTPNRKMDIGFITNSLNTIQITPSVTLQARFVFIN